jgi:hypothetical protein
MKKTLTLSLLIACAAFSSSAFAKDAKCKITLNNEVVVNGTCSFKLIGNDGSFVLSGKHGLYQDIEAFKVQMMSKDAAKVYAVGYDGDSNNWGKTTRSKSNPACWKGKTYQICVM